MIESRQRGHLRQIARSSCVIDKGFGETAQRSAARAKARTVGDPFNPTTVQGPQVDDIQFEKVISSLHSQHHAHHPAGSERIA